MAPLYISIAGLTLSVICSAFAVVWRFSSLATQMQCLTASIEKLVQITESQQAATHKLDVRVSVLEAEKSTKH